ncbi:MAG: hypothetical protein Satyrvirus7_28 [Satyrvirus sp.]|uniref:Uncharacterized protein n=1 Tax=Satyrvirus sp. TaxID=2487771 RepID=A0A3G5AF67_9VIRU|nr:MAG: hypothetical protein Satyrvirus7_28 [Satyrvirus sp.]
MESPINNNFQKNIDNKQLRLVFDMVQVAAFRYELGKLIPKYSFAEVLDMINLYVELQFPDDSDFFIEKYGYEELQTLANICYKRKCIIHFIMVVNHYGIGFDSRWENFCKTVDGAEPEIVEKFIQSKPDGISGEKFLDEWHEFCSVEMEKLRLRYEIVDKLKCAISNGEEETVVKMLTEDSTLLYQKGKCCCNMYRCGGCREGYTPVETFVYLRKPMSAMVVTLFENKILKPEHFTHKMLLNFIYFCHTDYQFKLLDIFLTYIPKEIWTSARSERGGEVKDIIQFVIESCMPDKEKESYFKLFIEMGAKPDIGSVIKDLVYYAIPDLLEYFLSKFPSNPSYFNELYFDRKYFHKETPMMQCLELYKFTEKQNEISDVKRTLQICIDHGMDMNQRNTNGENIYNYIANYGWIDKI